MRWDIDMVRLIVEIILYQGPLTLSSIKEVTFVFGTASFVMLVVVVILWFNSDLTHV